MSHLLFPAWRRFALGLSLLCAVTGLAGCATTGSARDAATVPAEENPDPFEGFNRAMYTFNEKLDDWVMKPVAKGYRAVLPAPARTGVTNFFNNLKEPVVAVNNLLQGKVTDGVSDLLRFVYNSTFGLAGLFDVATEFGLPRHDEDFGQTLAKWGVGDGPYLVLPFFGPSNARDAPALVVDWYSHPATYIDDSATRWSLTALWAVDKRAQLLDASDILEKAAGEDRYVFLRELYRQRRRNQVYDGNPPAQKRDSLLFEDDDAPPAKPSPK
jgi:phospholipid-binding lipoprotein MlaA